MYGFTKEQNRQFRELMRAGHNQREARALVEGPACNIRYGEGVHAAVYEYGGATIEAACGHDNAAEGTSGVPWLTDHPVTCNVCGGSSNERTSA